ncbi:hypothetical protein JXR01_01975 [Candidatus Kaiserbacteria bacterium]|nr:MAG: hypothetical protein JXR01_01975 [Candidatus Kaiserbacteria bacterium]
MDYLFQDMFNGIATLVAGLFVWLIYIYGKRDKKKEAATILLNEIYTAEREMNNIKKNKIVSDYTFILPSNHWNDFQHLFTKNFDADEMNKMSEFFKACSLAEESIKLIKSYLVIAMDQKSRVIQDELITLIGKSEDFNVYKEEKEKILNIFHKEDYWFAPSAPKEKLFDYLENIDQLSLSSVGGKLKSIRDSRWYKLTI